MKRIFERRDVIAATKPSKSAGETEIAWPDRVFK